MKTATGLSLVIFLLSVAPSILGQNMDLSGPWSGETVVPIAPNKDLITIVFKKAGDSYTGTVSDSLGVLKGTPLEKVKFERDSLTFELTVTVDGREIRVRTALKISGEKLVGSWETEDGDTGSLEMTRTK